MTVHWRLKRDRDGLLRATVTIGFHESLDDVEEQAPFLYENKYYVIKSSRLALVNGSQRETVYEILLREVGLHDL